MSPISILVALAFVVVPLLPTAKAATCLSCICKRESGCRAIGCNPDAGSLSCGYFQIKLPYYKDCGTPGRKAGESVDAAWRRCANNYDCAAKCVQAYVRRYASRCPGKSACEQMARLHNGGPNGCRTSATLGYWNAINKCVNGK